MKLTYEGLLKLEKVGTACIHNNIHNNGWCDVLDKRIVGVLNNGSSSTNIAYICDTVLWKLNGRNIILILDIKFIFAT